MIIVYFINIYYDSDVEMYIRIKLLLCSDILKNINFFVFYFSENFKNLQNNWLDLGEFNEVFWVVVIVERQEEKMDIDDDIYNFSVRSKYLK